MTGCRFCRVRAVVHFGRRTFCSNVCVEKYRAELRCEEAKRVRRAPAFAGVYAVQLTAPALKHAA